MIKQYDKVKLKNGKFAIIVEILEEQKAYIVDIEISEGDYETETILHSDISALIIEVEQPLAI
ncbi:MAG: hypothetical protein FWD38_06795 [Oscillospiraceae bacterium]|nr:hypothetical protein [Oscillospiraceae bacterium]